MTTAMAMAMTITITSGELRLDHAGLGAGAGVDRRLYFSHRALALAYRFWKRHFFRNLHNFWDLGRYSGPAGAGNFVVLCKPLLLIQGPELGDRLNRSSLLEFLLHGIRYAFPAEIGSPTRGIPTSYAAPPIRDSIADAGDLPPVWPYADGKVRGYSFVPLHKNVPQAALEDARLYELLALVDALRNGRARERQLAGRELTRRLEVPGGAKSKS
jgi:hypothetical protein